MCEHLCIRRWLQCEHRQWKFRVHELSSTEAGLGLFISYEQFLNIIKRHQSMTTLTPPPSHVTLFGAHAPDSLL